MFCLFCLGDLCVSEIEAWESSMVLNWVLPLYVQQYLWDDLDLVTCQTYRLAVVLSSRRFISFNKIYTGECGN